MFRFTGAGKLQHFLAFRDLPETEEGFDVNALAAHRHPREALEPASPGNLGICVEPESEQDQLVTRDFTLSDALT